MAADLLDLFTKRGPIRTIGVIGMGYVGIPAAALFAASPRFDRVYGFQRNSPSSGYKIRHINEGKNPLLGDEPGLDDLIADVVHRKKFTCTDDFSLIAECDAITIAIQTPFTDPKDLIPDFSALEEGIRQAGRYLTKGSLVVLESTITPGTTNGWACSILEEESGMKAGVDFGLAHAPERVMVGRLIRNIREHDRIVGGINDESTKRATELYSPILTTGSIIPMTSTAAEVTKTAENTFRDLQIAAINQLALYCESMGINVYDVRKGIDSLHGEGITRAILWPGAGVGGHCLTKDTYHLERGVHTAKVEDLDYPRDHESLYVLARTINDFMPQHMVHLAESGLARAGKRMNGARIGILGWSFIANSDDARNTPSELFYDICIQKGATLTVHDPWVRKYKGGEIPDDISEVVRDADLIAIFTGHKEYFKLDPKTLKQRVNVKSPVIVDGRNVIDPVNFIRNGFIYKGIGRGDMNNHPLVTP